MKISRLPLLGGLLDGSEQVPVIQNGETRRFTIALLLNSVAALLPAAFRGLPGGSNNTYARREDVASSEVPEGTDLLWLTDEARPWRYSAAIDAAYVAANPDTSVRDAAGRGFARVVEEAVSLRDFGPVGTPDDGPTIRRALASGLPIRFERGRTYQVGPDPASINPVTGSFAWSIRVPSNAVLIFETGAAIKAAAGIGVWNRVVSLQGADNVRIYGELRVDANVQQASAVTNEHMHGVFLFDTTNSYIERIHSTNARGDNVFIGGTDNSEGSRNNYLGTLRLRTAGRKCFVGQAWHQNVIGLIDADNRAGNWNDADNRLGGGGGCIDLEPDIFTGAVRNENWVGTVISRGAGDDFTAGITAAQGDAYVLNVQNYDLQITPVANYPAWTQYAMTINIGRLRISGLTGVDGQSTIFRAARLNVQDFELVGARPGDYILLLAAVDGERPRLMVSGELRLENRAGSGFESRDAEIGLASYRPSTGGTAFWSRGIANTPELYPELRIGTFRPRDCGNAAVENYVGLITVAGVGGYHRIDAIDHRDARAQKVSRILFAGTGASRTISIGHSFSQPGAVPIAWEGPDRYVAAGVGRFICIGSPDGQIAAGIGALAQRLDGAAGTSLYVKEAGAGVAGWAPK